MSKYIPKVGEECILQSFGFTEFNKRVRIDYIGEEVGCYTTLENGKDYSFSISDVIFQPILTKADVEREQLIEIIGKYHFSCIGRATEIQNAGFTIPKKVKRSDIVRILHITSTASTANDTVVAHCICRLLGDLVEVK